MDFRAFWDEPDGSEREPSDRFVPPSAKSGDLNTLDSPHCK
jgi:hypothetical protein